MDLNFSPEQQELMDAVRRFAREQVTPERLGAWEHLPEGIDPSLWKTIAELGWLGLALPTESGGSGLGLVDLACLLCECARGLVPTVVAASIRGAYALAQLDPEAPELPTLARGEKKAALALEERNATDPDALETRVEGEGREVHLHGEKWYVTHGTRADYFLVAARDEAGPCIVLAERSAAQIRSLRAFVSDDVQAVVRFDGAGKARRLTPLGQGWKVLAKLQRQQVALALAEMVGGMDAVLEMTVAYVKEREQFGRKIGAFQAVQHQVADMATAYTASRHLAWQAITRIAEDRDEPMDLPAAAAFVGQAFKRLTLTAHHLHGGAGYVIEHPLHYHSERAQALCIRYTPERDALARVASLLLD